MELSYRLNGGPSQGQAKAIRAGTSFFYLYGSITYDDVFDYKRSTTLCLYFDPIIFSASSCPIYNDAK